MNHPIIKMFLIIMILYTSYFFAIDFINAWRSGGTFLEGNQNMNSAIYAGVRGGYDFSSVAEAEAKCKEEGLQLCKKEEVIAGAKSNDALQNQCSSGWTTDAPRGWYSVKGSSGCGSDNTWNTYAPPGGKGSAHCCKPAPVSPPIDTTGRCGPLFNEQKCSPGEYCNEKNGWCGTTDAHKNAQASTKYDGQPTNKIDIDQAAIIAKNDTEVHNLTKNIFDKFNISYNDGLSTTHIEEMIRIVDDEGLPKEQIKVFSNLMMKMLDVNKNSKIDFNELLVMFFGMKTEDYYDFKKTEKAFSNTNINNNNNNNNYQILANGNILMPATGSCPNGCSMPSYDFPECENTIYNGKSYRQCPWVNTGKNNNDCKKCGAVLLPKNEYGYARTNLGYTDIKGIEFVSENIRKQTKIQNIISKKQGKVTKGDFYNIGKEFLSQHAEIKNYEVPDNITTNQYTLLGKLLFIYMTNKTNFNRSRLKSYIQSLYLEKTLNKKCEDCPDSNLNKNYMLNLEELKKKDAYAYMEAVAEAASDNRLGGSKTQMENKTAYRSNYKPIDPRKFPNPYNALWDIF